MMPASKRKNHNLLTTIKFLLMAQPKGDKLVNKPAGFTLIELLVGIIMAALIIAPILGLMVNILQTDRREQAKSTSEQELQAAADYITRDLQQAVYIYDANGVKAINAQLLSVPNAVPVLVFWKRKLLSKVQPISASAAASSCPTNCNDVFVYSLVVYYLIKDPPPPPTSTWSNTARIARWEIQDGVKKVDGKSYLAENDSKVGIDQGFEFNLSQLKGETITQRLNNWEKSSQPYTKKHEVLIDYIDDSTLNVPKEDCPADVDNSNPPVKLWQQVPNYDSADLDPKFKTYSFYACVYKSDLGKNTAQVFLRGNALARLNVTDDDYKANRAAFFPRAKIEVTGSGQLGLN